MWPYCKIIWRSKTHINTCLYPSHEYEADLQACCRDECFKPNSFIWCCMGVTICTYYVLPPFYRNQGISSSLPTLVTAMSTLFFLQKSYMEHLQTSASVSRYYYFLLSIVTKIAAIKQWNAKTVLYVSIPSMLKYFWLLVISFSSPQNVVQRGTWSCFVRMMSRRGHAGSRPCAC